MSNAKKFFVFNQIALTFAVVLFMIYGAIDVAFAENASKKVDGSSYEMADSTGFIISDSSKVKQLSYTPFQEAHPSGGGAYLSYLFRVLRSGQQRAGFWRCIPDG